MPFVLVTIACILWRLFSYDDIKIEYQLLRMFKPKILLSFMNTQTFQLSYLTLISRVIKCTFIDVAHLRVIRNSRVVVYDNNDLCNHFGKSIQKKINSFRASNVSVNEMMSSMSPNKPRSWFAFAQNSKQFNSKAHKVRKMF